MKFTLWALGPGLVLIAISILLDSVVPDYPFLSLFGLLGSLWCWFGLFSVMVYWTVHLAGHH
jgi:xanthosine utilization system XapX-like protein